MKDKNERRLGKAIWFYMYISTAVGIYVGMKCHEMEIVGMLIMAAGISFLPCILLNSKFEDIQRDDAWNPKFKSSDEQEN